MALITCNFHSDVLGMACTMNVILPQQTATQIGMDGAGTVKKEYPVLYLLHGLTDDHSIWCRRTSIERYVASMPLAVVMPDVCRGFYTDMKSGNGQYWTFISEEIPALVKSFFPISNRREDTFVAGLSMGGYGAFKLALSNPEKFAAAAALSGVTDASSFVSRPQWDDSFREEMRCIFGPLDKITGSDNDLFRLAAKLKESGKQLPELLQICGTEDYLYADNINFRNHCRNLGLPLRYEEYPGSHCWEFWDEYIKKVLNWLPLKK